MFSRFLSSPISNHLLIKQMGRAFSSSEKTLFEKIATKEIPTDLLFEDDKVELI